MTSFSRQACPQTTSPLTKRTALVPALLGLLSLIGISNSHAVSIGGCNNYVPLDGDVVVCTPTVSPVAGQGVIAPANNTSNNNISVTIQAGTFLDINGSTIGLGSGSTVINDGRLNTQSFTNGYGISAGVNGRSQLGGNSITNNGDITTAGSNAHGIFISAAAITNGANNTIINTGLIQTSGTGDGIRLFTTARGVTNQITNSGSIITAAKVAGIRLRSTESTDTIINTGIITMSGVDAVGILVLNTLNRPTVSNSGTITTTGPEGHAIYGEGAMTLINSGTLTSDAYAIYFQTGTRSAGSNSVTLKAGSNITGGFRFNPSKTSETLVFDGLVDANFDNNLLNVNNISAIQSADVTMSASSYLFGASEINVDQTSQLTISAPIGDAAIATSITKLGAGVLTLSGQSTYTGATTINAGTLRVGASNALPTNTAVIISGGTLALNNINATIGSLAGTGAVTLGTASITTGGSDTTYGGVISGAGGLIKNGAGTFTLSGQNTYTGSTQVLVGTLATLGDNRLDASLNVSVASGATFLLGGAQTAAAISGAGTINLGEYRLTTGAQNSTFSGLITGGAGGITQDGPGTLILAGTTDFLGDLIINSGTVDLTTAVSVRSDKIIELNAGGTLIVEQRTIIGILRQNGGTLTGGGELVASLIETESGSLNAIITDSSEFKRGISKITDGVTTIGAPNTFTGILKIEDGRLQLAPSSEAYAQGGSFAPETSVLLSGSGTLDLNGKSQTFSFISGTSGTVELGGGQLTINGTENSTFSGVITGAGGLVKDGSSVLTLAGNNTYTGDTTIEAGVLKLGVANAAMQTALTVNTGGTFDLNNFNQTLTGLAGAGSVTLGSGTLTVNSATSVEFGGDISGTGGLTKDGTGTLALSGQSTYTGATTINAGILQANVANALPSSTAATINAGTLALNNVNQTIGSLAGAGAVTLGTGTLTTGGNGSDTSYSGIISGTGGLTKDGVGTFTLLGNSTYSGRTVVDAGTLRVGVANAAMQTALTVNTGGTFDLNNFNQTLTGLAGAGSVTLGSGTLTVNGAANSDFAGDISGTGNLIKDGVGTLALSGQSTYTGATTINAGILQVNVGDALPTNTAVTINAGTFALNNVNQTIGSLAGAGAVTLGTGTLTTGGNGSDTSYSGIISGTGGLVKLGSGTLALSAANTYAGGTLLSQGVLVVGNDNALGTGSLETAQDTTLRAGKSNLTMANAVLMQGDTTIDTAGEVVLLTGTVLGTGKLIKVGVGTLELAGVNSFSGGTQVEQGVLALDVNGAASSGEVVMAAGTTLQAVATLTLENLIKLRGEVEVNTQGFDLTLNNVVTNNSVGVLVKTGSGMLTLNGVNTYTGGTTLVEGTLALYGRLASGVQIGSGTRLAGTGIITGDVVNNGLIQPQINGQISMLTIVGNYSGENGTFASTLESTTSNTIVADQLAIIGAGSTASGSTTIAISDPSGVLGQPTTGDGILLVGFSDGATGTGTAFRSDRIAAGAYEYELVRGSQSSEQDWYLRADNNAPAPPQPITPQTAQREEVALYPVLPTLVRQYLMNITGTLDERRGAPDSLPKERVAWARVIAQHNETSPPNVNDGPGLKANDWGLQIGVDFVRADLNAGHWRMGPVLTIGRSTGQAYNSSGSLNTGSISLDGYSLGLNATLAMDNGSYFDVLVQATRLTGVSANSPFGTSIQTTGWGLSGSVEGGWRLGFSDTVSLTPQVQFYGVHTQLADSGDLFSRIEMPNASMFVGRVGLKIAYDNASLQGPKTQLWARVSALSTLSGRDASTSFLNVAGTNPTVFQSQAPATWMSLDAGVTVNASPNTQINFGLGYQTSFNGQFTGVSGQINARFGF